MTTLKNSIFIASTLLLLSACSADPNRRGTTVSESGSTGNTSGEYSSDDYYNQGAAYTEDNLGYNNLDKLTPASQEDLAVNVGDRVFFDFNASSVSANGKRTLERQAEWLKKHTNLTITIEGHCDERGTREYNLALGEKRANSAKEFLIKKGVDASRINTLSYGKDHPEFLGSSEAVWSKNRRAVTVVNP